jgi:hypothetical protein
MSGGEQQKTSVVFFLLIFSRVPNKKKRIKFGGLRVGARAPLSFFLGEKKNNFCLSRCFHHIFLKILPVV